MSRPQRPCHFEIHCEDPQRAIKFYTDAFGWTFKFNDSVGMDYWLIITGEAEKAGINGGLLKRPGPTPPEGSSVMGYVVTMDVENIDETIAKIEAAGGKCQMPKMAMEGMAWFAYYKDLEGNIFGLWQNDTNAKNAPDAFVGEKRKADEPVAEPSSPTKK